MKGTYYSYELRTTIKNDRRRRKRNWELGHVRGGCLRVSSFLSNFENRFFVKTPDLPQMTPDLQIDPSKNIDGISLTVTSELLYRHCITGITGILLSS